MAEADDRFVAAATNVYSRYHRKKCVEVHPWRFLCTDRECIKVGKDIASKCFRHFGHLMSHLTIDFSDRFEIETEQSLELYWKESLRRLTL